MFPILSPAVRYAVSIAAAQPESIRKRTEL